MFKELKSLLNSFIRRSNKFSNRIGGNIFNASIEEPTQALLDNWVISKQGIFYWINL